MTAAYTGRARRAKKRRKKKGQPTLAKAEAHAQTPCRTHVSLAPTQQKKKKRSHTPATAARRLAGRRDAPDRGTVDHPLHRLHRHAQRPGRARPKRRKPGRLHVDPLVVLAPVPVVVDQDRLPRVPGGRRLDRDGLGRGHPVPWRQRRRRRRGRG